MSGLPKGPWTISEPTPYVDVPPSADIVGPDGSTVATIFIKSGGAPDPEELGLARAICALPALIEAARYGIDPGNIPDELDATVAWLAGMTLGEKLRAALRIVDGAE